MQLKVTAADGSSKSYPARVAYIRPPLRRRTTRRKEGELTRGTTVLTWWDGDNVRMVWASCNSTDNFSRKLGKKMCLARAAEILKKGSEEAPVQVFLVEKDKVLLSHDPGT